MDWVWDVATVVAITTVCLAIVTEAIQALLQVRQANEKHYGRTRRDDLRYEL